MFLLATAVGRPSAVGPRPCSNDQEDDKYLHVFRPSLKAPAIPAGLRQPFASGVTFTLGWSNVRHVLVSAHREAGIHPVPTAGGTPSVISARKGLWRQTRPGEPHSSG